MTKPIVKISYKLLYVIQGVKNIFDKVTSWSQLISKLLVAPAYLHAASDWPRTFFTLKVFLFSIISNQITTHYIRIISQCNYNTNVYAYPELAAK